MAVPVRCLIEYFHRIQVFERNFQHAKDDGTFHGGQHSCFQNQEKFPIN